MATIGFFCVALFFRTIDNGIGKEWFPMGTHFLWHICGGISVFFLLNFILLLSSTEKPTKELY
jgi:hemolysin III